MRPRIIEWLHSPTVVWRKPLLCACVIALLAAACAGDGGQDDEQRVPPSKMRSVVLQPTDLPKAFTRFDEGPVRMADTPPGPRGDPERFGREGGWKARYRRPGSPATRGPLVVESRVDVFDGAGGAEDELDAYRDELEGLGGRRLELPSLGADAIGVTSGTNGAPNTVQFFRLVWRYGNVTASLAVNGFEGKLMLVHVLELARKQQRRISAASTKG